MAYDRSLFARIITWIIAGVIVILLLRLTLFLLGQAIGFGLFLVFTILPILLVGWLALKLWDRLGNGTRHRDI